MLSPDEYIRDDDLTYMLITLRIPATRAPAIDFYGMLYKEITAFEPSKTASERPAPQRRNSVFLEVN
ncbi:MAG TPA: hypothetical protein VGC70_04050 [Burkholderiales bacterium]